MPSVVISALLLRSLVVDIEVSPQRIGDHCRQRGFRLDRVVLELPDQADRQVHVELLDVLIAHDPDASMLASKVYRRWGRESPRRAGGFRTRDQLDGLL